MNQIRDKATGVLALLAVFLVFLLPLKFGMMTGVPEAPVGIPPTLDALIIMFWPPMLFPVFSSLLLMGVIVLCPPLEPELNRKLFLPCSWVLLLISTILGFINASMMDFPIIQFAYISGITAFTLSLYRLIEVRPEMKIWLIHAIVLSTVLTAFIGLSQYFFGFQETLEYVKSKELETGGKVGGMMQNRLEQVRVFATFSICNSLAAHLILTLPICIWGILSNKAILKSVIVLSVFSFLYVFTSPNTNQLVFFPVAFICFFIVALILLKFPDEKIKSIALLTVIPVSGLILYILYLTQSRGGLVGLGTSIIFFTIIIPIKIKYKIITILSIIFGSFLVIFKYDIEGRDLSSIKVRLDYCLRSMEMFCQKPFLGTGWGDFFHEYTKMKTFPNIEAPHNPHNFIMNFASQAGIAGLCAAAFVFILPFYIFFRKVKEYKPKHLLKNKWLNIAIITGWCAWAIHSLADFNIQVPGTVAAAITLLLIMNSSPKTSESEEEEYKAVTGMRKKSFLVIWYGAVPIIALFSLVFSLHQQKFEISLSSFMESCNQQPTLKNKTAMLTDSQLEILLNNCSQSAKYSPLPWISAAKYAGQQGKWAKVEMYSMEALKRSPERASIYYHLAIAQKQLGKHQASLDSFKTAAKLFPINYREIYDKEKNKVRF